MRSCELFTKPLVTFEGRWHKIPDAGLKPLPVQRPIPIWFGGREDRALERTARLADGWMTNFRSLDEGKASIEKFRALLEKYNRTLNQCPIEVRIPYGDGKPETWRAQIKTWVESGVNYISLNTMNAGFKHASEHLRAVKQFAQATMK